MENGENVAKYYLKTVNSELPNYILKGIIFTYCMSRLLKITSESYTLRLAHEQHIVR